MMQTSRLRIAFMLPLLLGVAPVVGAADPDYAAMLAYLTHSQLDGNALHGATGAIGVNLSAGDFNQQANLRAIAAGDQAAVRITAQQGQSHNLASAPDVAVAVIRGSALGQASGLISINQASGTANAQLNTASVALAQQRTSGASTEQWLADVCACKQETTPAGSGQPASGPRTRATVVDAGAMRGTQGVVQLNQIAGSNNVTANHLLIDVGVTPR